MSKQPLEPWSFRIRPVRDAALDAAAMRFNRFVGADLHILLWNAVYAQVRDRREVVSDMVHREAAWCRYGGQFVDEAFAQA